MNQNSSPLVCVWNTTWNSSQLYWKSCDIAEWVNGCAPIPAFIFYIWFWNDSDLQKNVKNNGKNYHHSLTFWDTHTEAHTNTITYFFLTISFCTSCPLFLSISVCASCVLSLFKAVNLSAQTLFLLQSNHQVYILS